MQNKRIAVISYHTCPLSDEKGREIGGMNVYVLELAKQLARKGFILDLYTRSQSPESPRIVEVAENLRVIHLPAGKEASLPKKELITYIPEFLKHFYTFTKENDLSYDLASCHYYLSGIIGQDIKKRWNIPMTITFHTLALMKNLVARSEDEKEDIDRIKSELELVQKADRVIATSENDAEYLSTLYNCDPRKLSILAPGVNLQLFYPKNKYEAKIVIGADDDYKMLLFVGRIEPLKGIDIIIYAIKILLEKNPNLKLCLWIVGGDISDEKEKWSAELKKLEKLRRLLNIHTYVRFVGQKSQDQLPDYYNAAEIVLMPSHYESFGITTLEAMACGVPVITTDVTGVSGIIDEENDAMITSANNPLLLADKIKNLLTDKKEYDKARNDVLGIIKDLSWEAVADRYLKYIKQSGVSLLKD